MLTNVAIFWVFLVPAAVVVGSVILIVWSIRSGRTNDHPHCRRCGFDLYGTPAVARCPECGRDLAARKRAIRTGGRAVSWGRLAASLVVIAGIAWWTWPRTRMYGATVNWILYQPTWWLESVIDSPDQFRSERALGELTRRIDEDQLARPQVERLVRRALQRQRQVPNGPPWTAHWGNLVEAAIVSGDLADSEVIRYIEQGYAVSPTLFEPDPMWSSMLVTSIAPMRTGHGGRIEVFAALQHATLDDRDVPFTRVYPDGKPRDLEQRPMVNLWLPWTRPEKGVTMQATFRVRVMDALTKDLIDDVPVQVPIAIRGAPAMSTLQLVREPDLREDVVSSIEITRVTMDDHGTVRATLDVQAAPVGMAMAVIGYVPEAVVPLGEFVVAPGETRQVALDGVFMPEPELVETMTLIIRPSPFAARSGRIALREMWADDIIMPDVLVQPLAE